MSKAFKCRAWLIDRKEMVNTNDGGEVTLDFNRHGLVGFYYGKYDQTFLLSEFELLEFTGLHDKNGREIFEGDIVKDIGYGEQSYGYVYEIIYMTPRFVAYNPRKSPNHVKQVLREADNILDWKQPTETRWEVIGNIWENPEFLKEAI